MCDEQRILPIIKRLLLHVHLLRAIQIKDFWMLRFGLLLLLI